MVDTSNKFLMAHAIAKRAKEIIEEEVHYLKNDKKYGTPVLEAIDENIEDKLNIEMIVEEEMDIADEDNSLDSLYSKLNNNIDLTPGKPSGYVEVIIEEKVKGSKKAAMTAAAIAKAKETEQKAEDTNSEESSESNEAETVEEVKVVESEKVTTENTEVESDTKESK